MPNTHNKATLSYDVAYELIVGLLNEESLGSKQPGSSECTVLYERWWLVTQAAVK